MEYGFSLRVAEPEEQLRLKRHLVDTMSSEWQTEESNYIQTTNTNNIKQEQNSFSS